MGPQSSLSLMEGVCGWRRSVGVASGVGEIVALGCSVEKKYPGIFLFELITFFLHLPSRDLENGVLGQVDSFFINTLWRNVW